MKSKPNMYLSLAFGIIFSVLAIGSLVVGIMVSGQLNIYFLAVWIIVYGGILVGLQIHIFRKLIWFEFKDLEDETVESEE